MNPPSYRCFSKCNSQDPSCMIGNVCSMCVVGDICSTLNFCAYCKADADCKAVTGATCKANICTSPTP
jgi:hypothetical protein